MPSAYVTIKLKIPCSCSWGDKTTIEQIAKQAKEDAFGQLRQLEPKFKFQIIGDPEITAVSTFIPPQPLKANPND